MFLGWAKASACRLQVSLSCAVLCQIESLQYVSRSSLRRLACRPCRIFLSYYGLQVVTCTRGSSVVSEAVDMPCPGPFRLYHIADYMYMTFVHSLAQMLVFTSLYVMLSIGPTSFHFGIYKRPQGCSVLGWSVSRSLHHIS